MQPDAATARGVEGEAGAHVEDGTTSCSLATTTARRNSPTGRRTGTSRENQPGRPHPPAGGKRRSSPRRPAHDDLGATFLVRAVQRALASRIGGDHELAHGVRAAREVVGDLRSRPAGQQGVLGPLLVGQHDRVAQKRLRGVGDALADGVHLPQADHVAHRGQLRPSPREAASRRLGKNCRRQRLPCRTWLNDCWCAAPANTT